MFSHFKVNINNINKNNSLDNDAFKNQYYDDNDLLPPHSLHLPKPQSNNNNKIINYNINKYDITNLNNLNTHYSNNNQNHTYNQNNNNQPPITLQPIQPLSNINQLKDISNKPISSPIYCDNTNDKRYSNNNFYSNNNNIVNNNFHEQDQLTPQSNILMSPQHFINHHFIEPPITFDQQLNNHFSNNNNNSNDINNNNNLNTNIKSNNNYLIPSPSPSPSQSCPNYNVLGLNNSNSGINNIEMLDNIEIIQDNNHSPLFSSSSSTPTFLSSSSSSSSSSPPPLKQSSNKSTRIVPSLNNPLLNEDNNLTLNIDDNQTTLKQTKQRPNSPLIVPTSPNNHFNISPPKSLQNNNNIRNDNNNNNNDKTSHKRKHNNIQDINISTDNNDKDKIANPYNSRNNNRYSSYCNIDTSGKTREELLLMIQKIKEDEKEFKRMQKEKQDKLKEPLKNELIENFVEGRLKFSDISTDELLLMAPKVFGRVSKYNLFDYLFGVKERGDNKISDIVRYRDKLDVIISSSKQGFNYLSCPYCDSIIQTQKSLSQPHENKFSNKSCLKYHLLRIHKDKVESIVVKKDINFYDYLSENPKYRKCKHIGCPAWITSKHMCDHIIIDHHIEDSNEVNNCPKCKELKKKLKREFISSTSNQYQLLKQKNITDDKNSNNSDNNSDKQKNKKSKKSTSKHQHKDKRQKKKN